VTFPAILPDFAHAALLQGIRPLGAVTASGGGAPLAATLMPLASGLGYVAAVLLVKRASSYGVGLWRTAFVSNLAMGLGFAPLWLLGGAEVQAAALWQPALCAVLFFAGQVFTFAALAGEVSLATPVLGLKIIFVAGASALLLAEPVRPAWWIAAALATAAVGLLQAMPRAHAAGRGGQAAGRTIALAMSAALAFAVCDVLVQRFAGAWGVGRFLPLTFGLVAVFSFGLIPVFHAPLRTIPPAAWRWLAPGAILLAMQAASMAYTLGTHGRATAANILYSTRGLWSVLAIGLLGAWLGTGGEQRLPRAVFRLRLAGSALMLVAVVLVLE
jgi:drug/metabolite transporter (DMT)-like permease